MDLKENPSFHKCNLVDNDEELVRWRRILDLNSAAKTETDWYSTRTFQLFLDALDINQPVISDDKSNRIDSNNKSKSGSSKIETKSEEQSNRETIEEQRATRDKYHSAETILSAEALKILSELPDLSHMSSTRTFIFPNGNRDQRRT